MNVLTVQDISYHIGRRTILSEVSFRIEGGQFVVLLGRNGAGKSTLFALLMGLRPLRQGRIEILGINVTKNPTAALAAVATVFQDASLDLDLSVRENMRYYAGLHGLSRQDIDRGIVRELTRIGIAERAADRVRTLSGGLRRRVEIARALLIEPRLLLLDEASAGLDAAMRRNMIDHVRNMCCERGIAALWSTHLLDEVVMSDEVLVLKDGRVIASGRGDSVMAQARPALEMLPA